MSLPPRVLIIGGGIAGLSAAWECHRRQVPALVLEAADRIGGVIRTDTVDGCVLDAGPDAFLAQKPGAMTLCRELRLESELVGMVPPRGAFILAGDRLHPLPEGGAFGLPTSPAAFLRSSLLSWSGKARVALEPLVPRRRSAAAEEESAGAFFRRRFGQEAATRIAQPLLGGIHAGDLDMLSARAVVPQFVSLERQGRSVLLALRQQARRRSPEGAFRSFASGMGRLPDALRDALPEGTVRTGAPVRHVRRSAGRFVVTTADGQVEHGDILLTAVPAPDAAALIESLAPQAAALSAAIPYVSTATVVLGYPTAAIGRPLRGSGYVVAAEGATDPVIAVTWITGKWPGRAPAGTTLLRVFFGGAGSEAVLDHDDDTLRRLAHTHVAARFAVSATPTMARVYRWIRRSPQHHVGHPGRVAQLQQALDASPGLGVAGSGFRAVGIPDVVSDARREMGRLIEQWHKR
jgi:protoporphyrinogen/coproporphyrinogen III oxidase